MNEQDIADYEAFDAWRKRRDALRMAPVDIWIAACQYRDSKAAQAELITNVDPCPNCTPGVVCRTPSCGRLKGKRQEPDLLDLKLPIAIRVGGGIFGKGVSLRTVANQLKRIQDTYDDDLKARMSKQSICRENETAPAVAQEPVGSFVGWQRRHKHPSTPGQICAWESCSEKEATDPFEKKPAYEYRKIYTEAPAVAVKLTDSQIEAGAKKLAELFDYPWDFMPDQGKSEMRGHVQTLFEAIAAAEAAKGGQS